MKNQNSSSLVSYVDQVSQLKNLLASILTIAEKVKSGVNSALESEKLISSLEKFVAILKIISIDNELTGNLNSLIKIVDEIKNIIDQEILILKLNEIILLLKAIFPAVIKNIKDIDVEKSLTTWDIDSENKVLHLKFIKNPKILISIEKYKTLDLRLSELDQEFLNDEIPIERFQTLRPIMVAKIAHLLNVIGMSLYD